MRAALSTGIVAGLVAGAAVSLARPAGSFEYTAAIEAGYGFGETEYIYDESFTAQGGRARLKSQLEFPLDTPLVRLRLSGRAAAERHAWVTEVRLATNLGDPGGLMKDHDWVTDPNGFDGKFSYTESSATLRTVRVSVESRLLFRRGADLALGPLAGLRYQRIRQEVVGFSGWQIDTEQPPYEAQDVAFDGLGIRYRVSYVMPIAGGALSWRLGGGLEADLQAALVPVHFSDFDDHVLRFKTGEASGWGFGYLLDAGLRKTLGGGAGAASTTGTAGTGTAARRPFAAFRFALLSLTADGEQTQRWYGDDSASPEDDTGTVIDGIPHQVHSTQLELALSFGMAF